VSIGLIFAAALALPGVTVTTRSLDGLFLLIEEMYRGLNGQVAGVDFHTIKGPLVHHIPALGYVMSGSFGGAMPLGMGLTVLVTSLLAAHVLTSRLRPFLALMFASFLLLIVAAPINLGGAVTGLTFVSFDSRTSWGALGLLLVMYLRPLGRPRSATALDAFSAAALTLALIFMRGPFGLAAVVFLLFMLTDRRQFRWVIASILITVATVVVLALFWRGFWPYFGDVWGSIHPDDGWGSAVRQLLSKAVDHLTDFLLLTVLAGVVLWKTWSIRHLVFFLLCSIAGLWLLSTTGERWGIISIHAAAAVAAELLLRGMDRRSDAAYGRFVNPSGVKLFFLAFVLPTIVHCLLALMLHAGTAAAGTAQALALPRLDSLYLADLWTGRDFKAASSYLDVVNEGLDLVAEFNQPARRLATLGSADIFTALLGLQPPEHDIRGPAREQTTADRLDMSLDTLLKSVDMVLVRRSPDASGLAEKLDAVRRNFEQVGASEHWLLFHREAASEEPILQGQTWQ
jgi:hypothetical protein